MFPKQFWNNLINLVFKMFGGDKLLIGSPHKFWLEDAPGESGSCEEEEAVVSNNLGEEGG